MTCCSYSVKTGFTAFIDLSITGGKFQKCYSGSMSSEVHSHSMLDGPKTTPLYDERPWGNFTVLDEGATYKVKRIEVLPGKRLSYQKHSRRSEHWMVVAGQAKVMLDGAEVRLSAGQTIDISIG